MIDIAGEMESGGYLSDGPLVLRVQFSTPRPNLKSQASGHRRRRVSHVKAEEVRYHCCSLFSALWADVFPLSALRPVYTPIPCG
jgi:hypothetical protein